jgi:DNA-binding CsgD family transcriptional regulator
MAFAGFTDLELKVIALRVSGLKGSEIAEQLGFRRQVVYDALWQACKKAGIKNDVALLTRWALEWGFDTLLQQETSLEPETFRNTAYPGKPEPGTV